MRKRLRSRRIRKLCYCSRSRIKRLTRIDGARMHRNGLISAVIAMPGLVMTAAAFAQVMSDGDTTFRAGKRSTPAVIAGMARRYHVAATCSSTGSSNTCATVVDISNLTTGACDVGVEFYAGATGATPACTAVFNDLPANRQATICSRTIAFPPASCNSTCNPGLTNNSGYAIIYSDCAQIAVQATIYTKDPTDSVITSAQSINLIAYRDPPETKANKGD